MTFLSPLAGGVLIGIAAALYLFANGRIAGISGILGNVLEAQRGALVDVAFLAGLVLAGVAATQLAPAALGAPVMQHWPVIIGAGLLVGIGTRLGNGCTSGHGVCGMGRGSRRSFVAVLVFMATAALTVFVARHLMQVSP